MDQHCFDSLTRSFATLASRREVWRGLAVLGLGAVRLPGVTDAKKKHEKRKKAKKPKPNAYGCLDVGHPCNGDSSQCCSSVCHGKKPKSGEKDRSHCVAHDASICKVESDLCLSGGVLCSTTNLHCACVRTTGNAPFCGDFSLGADQLCRDCSQDTDCQEEFGPGAACIVYAGLCAPLCSNTGGTACMPACNDAGIEIRRDA